MSDLSLTIIMLVVLVPSVILHEIAHAYTANALGDNTAARAGRLSLNPIRHIDPVGTLAVPLILALAAPFIIAWAKPVPVVASRLRSPRVHSLLVALAGPTTNFAIAGLAIGTYQVLRPDEQGVLWAGLALLTIVNIVLGVFNLLPIPPLDGSAIIEFLLPRRMLDGWYRVRSFSFILLFGFMIFGRDLLSPVFEWALDLWRIQG
jgi:Zn-dependent protease